MYISAMWDLIGRLTSGMRRTRVTFVRMLAFLVLSLLVASCEASGESDKQNAKSTNRRIVETGELAAVNSQSFVIQRFGRRWNSFRVIGILKHGTKVEAGDSVIQLDPSDIQKYIIDREGDLENQLAALEKMLVDQTNRRNDLESRMKTEVATYELRKLELEAARFESERIRTIKELEFKQATIAFERAKRQLELNDIKERSSIKIQQIRVNRLREDVKTAYEILPQLTIRTPSSGIFQVAYNRRTREMVKAGDELYQNSAIGSVPDLTWMKVKTTVNELDFIRIQDEQEVKVRLDAMPELVFDGKVAYIGKLCRKLDEKSKQKVFDVEVNLLKPDERLKPGMTVSCEFITD